MKNQILERLNIFDSAMKTLGYAMEHVTYIPDEEERRMLYVVARESMDCLSEYYYKTVDLISDCKIEE